MSMKQISMVAFDLDGIILDSMPILTKLAVDTLVKAYNISESDAISHYTRTVGSPFAQQLEIIFPRDHRNFAVARQYEQEHTEVCEHLPISNGVPELIKWLKEERYNLALVSSTHHDMIHHFLPQVKQLRFDYLGGYKEDFDKASQLVRACILLGKRGEEALFVSDSENDMAYAEMADTRFQLATCANVAAVVKRCLQ